MARRLARLLLVVLVALAVTVWPASAAGSTSFSGPLFTVNDLGTLKDGTWSYGFEINNRGQVAGFAGAAGDTVNHAFRWQSGAMKDLGTLGGPTSAGVRLNSTGQVAGVSDLIGPHPLPDGNPIWWHAVLWDSRGKIHDLGTLGGPTSGAEDVNDLGQVVGTADGSEWIEAQGWYQWMPFIWENGQMRPLFDPTKGNPLGGHDGNAYAINNLGQVAGDVTLAGDSENHCALWSGPRQERFTDLGSMGGWCQPWYINDQGLVDGNVWMPDGTFHAWKWQNGKATVLPPLPGAAVSQARGSSSTGLVLGWSYKVGDPDWRAVVWYGDKPIDLNTLISPDSGWYLATAVGINGRGQIVGTGGYQGETDGHAYMLSPTRDLMTALASAPQPTASSAKTSVAAPRLPMLDRSFHRALGRPLGR